MKTVETKTHKMGSVPLPKMHRNMDKLEREGYSRTLVNEYVAFAGKREFRDLIKDMSYLEIIFDSRRQHKLSKRWLETRVFRHGSSSEVWPERNGAATEHQSSKTRYEKCESFGIVKSGANFVRPASRSFPRPCLGNVLLFAKCPTNRTKGYKLEIS